MERRSHAVELVAAGAHSEDGEVDVHAGDAGGAQPNVPRAGVPGDGAVGRDARVLKGKRGRGRAGAARGGAGGADGAQAQVVAAH